MPDMIFLNSAALGAGTDRRWVRLAYPGTFRGYGAGEFTLNEARFTECISNFNERGLPVPYDINHASEDPEQNWRVEVAEAKGWVHTLRLNGSDLEGYSELVDDAAIAAVRANPSKLPYISPAFRLNAQHPETGRNIGMRLTSVALCTQPFLSRQAPLSLTDDERKAVCRVDELLKDPLCEFTLADRPRLVRMCLEDPGFFARTVGPRKAPAHLSRRLVTPPRSSDPPPREPTKEGVNLPAPYIGEINSIDGVRAQRAQAEADFEAAKAECERRRAAQPPPPPPPPSPFENALPAAALAAAPELYEAVAACRANLAVAQAALSEAKRRAVKTGSPAGLADAGGHVALAEAQVEAAIAAVAEHEAKFPAVFRAELERRHANELAALTAASEGVPLADIYAAVEALRAAMMKVEAGIANVHKVGAPAVATGRLLGLSTDYRAIGYNDVELALGDALAALGKLPPIPRSICHAVLRRFVA